VAVSVATTAAATAEVVAWKLPVLAPASMFRVAGTVADAELLARLIDAPPEPALPDSVTVHVLGEPPTTVAGAQLAEEIVTPPPPLPLPTLIDPDVADSATGSPDGSDPATPPSVTPNEEAVAVRLKVSEATTPLPIAFALIPQSTQLYPAGAWAQVTVMPAAAAPAAAVTELTSPPGYVIAHCSAPSEVAAG
jgi:hypothetical protein